MKIIPALPPNIDELDRVFGVRKMLETGPVWFAWGDRIYNPNRVDIPPAIMVHEKVHCDRQMRYGSPELWWPEYMRLPEFRLAEEIPAHQAEYEWWRQKAHTLRRIKGWRSPMDYHLAHIAMRLAGPMYGSLVPLSEAKRLISA